MYNPGCCGKIFLPEHVQWCRLRRNRHSHIGTNFCSSECLSLLSDKAFSQKLAFLKR